LTRSEKNRLLGLLPQLIA